MGLIQKVTKFKDDVVIEMSKVSWPSLESLKGSTWVVIALSIFISLYIFVIDKALSAVIIWLYQIL